LASEHAILIQIKMEGGPAWKKVSAEHTFEEPHNNSSTDIVT
jgi:hypothetical protein